MSDSSVLAQSFCSWPGSKLSENALFRSWPYFKMPLGSGVPPLVVAVVELLPPPDAPLLPLLLQAARANRQTAIARANVARCDRAIGAPASPVARHRGRPTPQRHPNLTDACVSQTLPLATSPRVPVPRAPPWYAVHCSCARNGIPGTGSCARHACEANG